MSTSIGSKNQFGVGVKDYCVYWFPTLARPLAPEGRSSGVGLATNSIAEGKNRRGRA